MKTGLQAQQELTQLAHSGYTSLSFCSGYFKEGNKWIVYAGDREVFVEEKLSKKACINFINN